MLLASLRKGHTIPNFGGFCPEGNAPLHRWQRFVVGSNYGHRKGGALTDDTPPESSAEAS